MTNHRSIVRRVAETVRRKADSDAFTLIELLVSMVILLIIVSVTFVIIDQVRQVLASSSGKIASFEESRAAFESLTRRLSQATLNPYYDFDSPTAPTTFLRKSNLQFVSGNSLLGVDPAQPTQITHALFFQAPLGYVADNTSYQGLNTLLNGCGYFVEYGPEVARPAFLGSSASPPLLVPLRYRYRLMQFVQPSQNLAVYDPTKGKNNQWFTAPLSHLHDAPPPDPLPASSLAENVVALVFLPMLAASENSTGTPLVNDYAYDSAETAGSGNPQLATENQLPPVMQVTMVAIDEPSALRLGGGTTTAPDLGQSQLFKSVDQYKDDIEKLTAVLNATPGNIAQNHLRLNYRIFRVEVALRGAKWSSSN